MFELWVTNPDGNSYQEFYRRSEANELAERIAELLTYDKTKIEVIYPSEL